MNAVSQKDSDAESTTGPQITCVQDLDAVIEDIDPTIRSTTTRFFFGKVSKQKTEITAKNYTDALEPVLDDIVLPIVSNDTEVVIAPNDSEVYTKRPDMTVYDLYNDDDFLVRLLLSEALIMETIAQHPHPNIIRYHGVRNRRGRITGVVMDKYEHTLVSYVRDGHKLDQGKFLGAVESTVAHLRALGLAHNDINPENIMIGPDEMPILSDFGSCGGFGKRVLSQGTDGWVDVADGRSGKGHNVYALAKMREWFADP